MLTRRATQPAAKARRREEILEAAAQLFETIGYDNISMALVAERAGLAKGTPYRYFSTREAVFLALYSGELDRWAARLMEDLPGLPRNDCLRLAGLVADSIDAQPRLPALGAILHTVLERNIDMETAEVFKRQVLRHLLGLGSLLEKRLDFLAPGEGARLLLRLHSLVIGTWHSATPAPVLRKLLERDEFAPFRIDFSEELENSFFLLLEGWQRQSET